MRIKSYFAPSVQSAISLARREFGDEVTLVTSHVAAPDARHLGEYEVVFAVDEEDAAPEPVVSAAPPVRPPDEEAVVVDASAAGAVAPFNAFQTALLEAVSPKPATETLREQIGQVRTLLVALGIEPSMVRALMTLVERSVDTPVGTAASAGALAQIEEDASSFAGLADSLTMAPVVSFAPLVIDVRPKAERQSAPARMTAAEQAFLMSVSGDSEKKSEMAVGAISTMARY